MQLFWSGLIVAASLVNANALPEGQQDEKRNAAVCNGKVIRGASSLLNSYSSTASKICSSLLSRGPPPTVTTTATITLSTITTKTSGVVTSILTSGTNTVTVPTITTATEVSRTVDTSVITQISSQVTTTVLTAYTTTTTTSTYVYRTTAYKYSYDDSPPQKRAAPSSSLTGSIGGKFPDCPKSLKPLALSLAATACSCYLPPVTTRTSTVQTTTTVISTVLVPSTAISTTPATTTTAYSTSTSYVTSEQISTSLTTINSVVAVTVSSTTTQTSTSYEYAYDFSTASATATYKLLARSTDRPGCRYAKGDTYWVNNLESCAYRCSSRGCSFFFSYNRDGVGDNCDLYYNAYDAAQLACGDQSVSSNIGYRRV